MSREPFFSVIIPTRNRAHLLTHALQSALNQTFDEYEIVVSDNCSQDDTAGVVQEVGGSRVRYVRPDRTLSMPDHWEFAVDQARGQYVTYLCDDDAWSPQALQRAADAIARHQSKLVALYSAIYYGSNWFDAAYRNSILMQAPQEGKERLCRSSETLTQLFTCRIAFEAPRMLNSFCHRDTLLEVRAECQRLFLMCPDYSFAAFILTKVPTWVYIEEPLHLQGVFAEGIGSTQYYNRGEPSREFIREFDESKLLKRVPMEAPVVTNFIAETLLRCKEVMASKLAGYEINQEQYFIGCWQDILRHEQNGVRVERDKEEFLRVLARQPQEVQDAVRPVLDLPAAAVTDPPAPSNPVRPNPIKGLARKIINSSAALTNLESRVRRREVRPTPDVQPQPSIEPTIIRGQEAGFSNILEAAQQLSTLVKRTSRRTGAASGK